MNCGRGKLFVFKYFLHYSMMQGYIKVIFISFINELMESKLYLLSILRNSVLVNELCICKAKLTIKSNCYKKSWFLFVIYNN